MWVSGVPVCDHSWEVAHRFLHLWIPWVLGAGGRAACDDGVPSQLTHVDGTGRSGIHVGLFLLVHHQICSLFDLGGSGTLPL